MSQWVECRDCGCKMLTDGGELDRKEMIDRAFYKCPVCGKRIAVCDI